MEKSPALRARQRRVLIVEDDSLVGMGLAAQVQEIGHVVVGHASSAAEARSLFESTHPDLVLVDIKLNNSDGIGLSTALLEDRRVPIVIISAYGDDELIDRATLAGVFGYLIKPVSTESLRAQIEVTLRRFAELDALFKQNQTLAQTLEARKLLERAKGIFMRRLNLDEAEAHRRLQLESQNRRIGLAELARKIIESEELLGGQPK